MAIGDKIVISNKNNILLEKIKEVDGDGSRLDADLLRGLPADFTNDLSENGYQILPSGFIIQWMYADNSTSGDITFTFPIAFPNALLFTSGQQTSDDGADNTTISFDVSTTQASYSRRRYDSDDTAEAIFVIAIGY